MAVSSNEALLIHITKNTVKGKPKRCINLLNYLLMSFGKSNFTSGLVEIFTGFTIYIYLNALDTRSRINLKNYNTSFIIAYRKSITRMSYSISITGIIIRETTITERNTKTKSCFNRGNTIILNNTDNHILVSNTRATTSNSCSNIRAS